MRFLAGLVAAWVLLCLLAWIFQRRLIYLPMDHRVPPVREVFPDGRELELQTADGLSLGAWLVPPPAGDESWGAALICNGNAGHRAYRAGLAAGLARSGLAVLLFDYRGYGENGGSPSEAGLLEDALAARRGLLEASGLEPDKLIYFGESLGAGVAVALAAKAAPGALVLRSPFTSLADVGRIHYPFLPVRTLLRDRFDSLALLPRVPSPVMIVAGSDDRIVPARLSERLFEAASEPKRLLLLDGADHNDHPLVAGPEMIREVVSFLEEALGDQPRSPAARGSSTAR